jgi:transposase
MKSFKRHKDYGFWDQDLRLSKISKLGDPLERLNEGINFDIFRGILEEKLSALPKGTGGRPPYDYVLMFKILLLPRFYNLSDDQAEYQIKDRLSFMRFLDLTISDDIPDSRTVWHFRKKITDLGIVEELFSLFLKELGKLNLIVNEGKIIDASFVEVPRQRNKVSENEEIKKKVKEKHCGKINPRKRDRKT